MTWGINKLIIAYLKLNPHDMLCVFCKICSQSYFLLFAIKLELNFIFNSIIRHNSSLYYPFTSSMEQKKIRLNLQDLARGSLFMDGNFKVINIQDEVC